MTEERFVALVLGGLVACYWAGYKFGYAVRMIKNLGNHA